MGDPDVVTVPLRAKRMVTAVALRGMFIAGFAYVSAFPGGTGGRE
jgi:hypothetical protein